MCYSFIDGFIFRFLMNKEWLFSLDFRRELVELFSIRIYVIVKVIGVRGLELLFFFII